MTKPKRIKVPAGAATVLAVLDSRVRTMQASLRAGQTELGAIIEAGQAYAVSVGLDPAVSYNFEPEGQEMFATEVGSGKEEATE